MAAATAYLLFKRYGKPITHDRYASLDGLRGYLAFFVYLHHSSIWFFYLRSNQWKIPPSNLYTHFGQSSVALFFMITGFLFFSKLMDGKENNIDWDKLFVSRILRLTPLYFFTMSIMMLIVIIVSKGVLHESILQLIKDYIRWLGFTILGAPNLNGVQHTSTIVAGVTWSLPYEWFFYSSLPLLALTVGVRAPLPYLLLSIATTMVWMYREPAIYHLLQFLGGIAASLLVRSTIFRRFAVTRLASLGCIGSLMMAVLVYPTAHGIISLLMLSTTFIFIACGNTLFGLLIHPVSRTLGEMAYSIYLLHGLMLFTVFDVLIGATTAADYSPIQHWVVIAAITPILILCSFVTFRLIESPAMKRVNSVTIWLRSRLVAFSKIVISSR